MTIWFPDLSHYNNVSVEPKTVAVCAKATQAVGLVDSAYYKFRQQAADVGAIFFAYHWLNLHSISEQAQHAYAIVGPDTPLMIDAEDTTGNTGFSGYLTVQSIIDFVNAYRSLGGICNLVYLPHWYWQNRMGSPDLQSLADNGLFLVSSNYTTYDDNGPGWDGYGGIAPVIWQYTDALPYGGGSCDFNAYKGTIDDLSTLIHASHVTPNPQPNPNPNWDDIMTNLPTIQSGSTGYEVKVAQSVLNIFGYGLSVDGMYGVKTTAAVKSFQSKKNLGIDGIVGPHTWSVLIANGDYVH
jgi:Putative peptidoglycan binding domain/Glycosyl hydrolases family 25